MVSQEGMTESAKFAIKIRDMVSFTFLSGVNVFSPAGSGMRCGLENQGTLVASPALQLAV